MLWMHRGGYRYSLLWQPLFNTMTTTTIIAMTVTFIQGSSPFSPLHIGPSRNHEGHEISWQKYFWINNIRIIKKCMVIGGASFFFFFFWSGDAKVPTMLRDAY